MCRVGSIRFLATSHEYSTRGGVVDRDRSRAKIHVTTKLLSSFLGANKLWCSQLCVGYGRLELVQKEASGGAETLRQAGERAALCVRRL